MLSSHCRKILRKCLPFILAFWIAFKVNFYPVSFVNNFNNMAVIKLSVVLRLFWSSYFYQPYNITLLPMMFTHQMPVLNFPLNYLNGLQYYQKVPILGYLNKYTYHKCMYILCREVYRDYIFPKICFMFQFSYKKYAKHTTLVIISTMTLRIMRRPFCDFMDHAVILQ